MTPLRWSTRWALILILTGAVLLITSHAMARQLGNGGTTYSDLMARTRPEEFLGRFIELTRADAAANTALLEVLGSAEGAGVAAGGQPLDMNASVAEIGRSAAAAGAVHELVTQLARQQIGSAHPLGDTDKARFTKGALALAQLTHDFTALTKNLGSTKQALSSAGAPARVALYAARATPDLAAQLRTELLAVLAYASAHQIALPAAVSEAAAP